MRAIIEATRQDVSYAWRMVKRSPGFTFFATLTIALGLGANAAIFSMVDGVLLKSFSYPEPERIVQLWEKPPRGLRNGISAANFIDWTRQSRSFEAMAAQTGAGMSYSPSAAAGSTGEPRLLRSRSSRRRTSRSSARRRRSDGPSPGTKTSRAGRRSLF